jgi:maternal embryonic leucine zipper kinase
MEKDNIQEPISAGESNGLPSLNSDGRTCTRSLKARAKTFKLKNLSLPVDLKKNREWMKELEYHIADYYNVMEKLGFGTYWVVRRAICKKSGQEVAVKISKGSTSWRLLKAESEIMKLIQSDSVPKFFEFQQDARANCSYLFMEYIKGTPLDIYVQENGVLSESESRTLISKLISTVQSLHDKGIAHRDIKPQNILVTEDKEVKLIDFNISKMKKEGSCKSDNENQKFKWIFFSQISSPMYAAPEILSKDCYSESVDIWGVGVAFCEMLFQISNLLNSNKDERILDIFGHLEELHEISDETTSILKAMLSKNPEERPSIYELSKQFDL